MAAQDNVAAISTLCSQYAVDALIASPDPVLRLFDKSYTADFSGKEYQSGSTIKIPIDDQPLMPKQQVARSEEHTSELQSQR